MLAGRMKLNHFLLIVGAFAIAGIALLVWTCDTSSTTPQPTAERPTTPERPVEKPATPSPAAAPQPQVDGPAERDVDRAIMQWAGKNLGSDKIKDAVKNQSFKVNLYQDAGQSVMNRAKVDLDRDDKWDEKWTFEGSTITRQVAPNDDENYTETYLWRDKAWAKQ